MSISNSLDVPIVLSDGSVGILDPHEEIYPGKSGMKIELDYFFREPQYSGHKDCFLTYFNCNGSNTYNGTIFRFPLRNKESNSQIKPDGIYNASRVMKTLFEPLKREANIILLFLKNVKSIKLLTRAGVGQEDICEFSVEIPKNHLGGVERSYLQICGSVSNKGFQKSIKVTINVFPISSSTCVQDKVILVLNMIGFPSSPSKLREFYVDNNLDYLPWIGIAIETGIVGSQLKKSVKFNFQYDWDGNDILSFIKRIIKDINFSFKVPKTHTLALNSGKLFCFLPTPELSHLPVSFHGYFALSNDRRRIKWPTLDSDDTDSNWNRMLIEEIGVSAYAIFYRVLIHCFQHEIPEVYHYRLFGEENTIPQSLPDILVNQGLQRIANDKIVYSTVLNEWIEVSTGLYHPIQYENIKYDCFQTEVAIENLLRSLSEPLVTLPSSVLTVLNRVDTIKSVIDGNRITPNAIRQLLRNNCDSEALTDYFLKNLKQDTLVVLSFILSDLYPSYHNPENCLEDVPLLISATSQISKFSLDNRTPFYMYQRNLNFINLFPGIEHLFVSLDIPAEIHSRLLSISQAGMLNIRDISNCLKTDTSLLTRLFQRSLKSSLHSIDSAISWNPSMCSFNKDWIKLVWSFIGSDEKLVRSLGVLPLLPKESLCSVNQLLPIVSPNNSYILYSNDEEHSGLEELLRASGAIFIRSSRFIECLESLTIKQIPNGLLTLLEKNSSILDRFIQQLNSANNEVIFSNIVDVLNTYKLYTIRQHNTIRRLPIFLNMAGGHVSLSSSFVRVPASIGLPARIQYPINYLSPDCSNLNILYGKLGIANLDINGFVTQHLMTLMQTLRVNRNWIHHSLLSKWLLSNIDKLSSEVIRVLREFEWIVDNSKFSVSKCGDYRKPSELFYPDDSILSQILPARSRFFTHREYSHTTTGTQLFLASSQISNQKLFEEIIKTAVLYFSLNEGDWENRFSSLLKFLNSCWRMKKVNISSVSNSLLNSLIALPLCNRPDAYPRSIPFLGVRKLCKIQSVVFCTAEEVPLIASVRQCVPLFKHTNFLNQSTDFKPLLTQLNCHTSVTGDMLVEQLNKISQTKIERSDSQNLHTVLSTIYTSPLILNLKGSIISEFVYVKAKNIFVAATQVVLNLNISLEPYYYSFEKLNYPETAWTLLQQCGACNAITPQQLNDILEILYKNKVPHFTAKEIGMILKIIHYLFQFEDELTFDNLYLLGEDNLLHLSTECVFYGSGCSGNKITVKKDNIEYFVVNSEISNSIATKFGAKSLKLTLLGNASGIFECVGQYEHLTTRLKSILKDYESTIDVFKELIQNADDAKASTVRVLIDYCTFPKVSLIEPSMKHWQGPAMYFYNDAEFTDKDFENIMKIFGETKLDDVCKIGKFGLGFNTVYHLTDLPSFVSGRYVYMLDPHRKYLVDENSAPGIRVNFIQNSESILEYRDQFNVFNLKLFKCNVFNKQPFKGTLFRLPFRSSDVSSDISSTRYDKSQIDKLKTHIRDETESNILFLQHVTCIEIYERNKEINEVQLLRVSRKAETNPFPKHETFISQNLDNLDRDVSHHQLISITTSNANKTPDKYFVSYSTGTRECAEFLRQDANRKISTYTPVASIALPENTVVGNSPDLTSRCNMYCYLPLPATSPYPMFINGCFALDQSRRGIACTEDDSERTKWNQALISDALVNSLINLLTHIKDNFTNIRKIPISQFYKLWPLFTQDHSVVWKGFPHSFATRLKEQNTPLFYNELNGRKWIGYKDANFFLSEQYYPKNLLSDFFLFVRKLCITSKTYFIHLEGDIHSSFLFQCFFEDSNKIYSLERICSTFVFPQFHTLSFLQIKLVLTALLPIVLIAGQAWIKQLFSTTKCIPCGSNNSYALLFPSSVVSPHSVLAKLYAPVDNRTIHPDFVSLFAKKSDHYKAMKSLNIIENLLPVEDVIDRCKCQEHFVNPQRGLHCKIILEYLNTKLVEYSKHYPEKELKRLRVGLLNINFIPVWRDRLLIGLQLQSPVEFSSPSMCFSFQNRFIISPEYYAVTEEVDIFFVHLNTFLALKHYSISINMPISLLKSLKQSEKDIHLLKLQADLSNRAGDIYSELFELWHSNTGDLSVNAILRDLQWIWDSTSDSFCHVKYMVSSQKYLCFESKFLSSFPYKLTDKNRLTSSFLKELGIQKDITPEIACEILSRIAVEHGNAIRYSGLLLRDLIIEITNLFFIEFYNTTNPVLLSSDLKLCPPNELRIDDMPWRKGIKQSKGTSNSSVHGRIHPAAAFNLGATSIRSEWFTKEHFTIGDFGQHEDIATRIDNLKRGFPCGTTILKELIQNAEDAGATEVAFVLDNRDYSPDKQSLCFSELEQPNWQKYQECSSLLVYNNSTFSEQDLEGIQSVGLGGKKDRHTIGKFGLGFNAVYHLTDSPCLLTRRNSDNLISFCIFDPYRKFLKLEPGKPPGMRLSFNSTKINEFPDQFKPYSLESLNRSGVNRFPSVTKGAYTLFRIPLMNPANGQKIENILSNFLIQSANMNLFLENIQRISIYKRERDGRTSILGVINVNINPSGTVSPVNSLQSHYVKNINISVREITVEKNDENICEQSRTILGKRARLPQDKWILFTHTGSIEGLESCCPAIKQHKGIYEKEKLAHQVYGGIAVRVPNTGCTTSALGSCLYSYLPIGDDRSMKFPVVINAPFILEPERQHIRFKDILGDPSGLKKWEDVWHSAIIEHVLTPLFASLILYLRHRSETVLNTIDSSSTDSQYYAWFYSLFPNMEALTQSNEKYHNFLYALCKQFYSVLYRCNDRILIDQMYKEWYCLRGADEGVFPDISNSTVYSYLRFFTDSSRPSKVPKLSKEKDNLSLTLNKIRFPLTSAPHHVEASFKKFSCNLRRLDQVYLLLFLNKNEDKFCNRNISDMVLNMEDIEILLEYLFNATTNVIQLYRTIPLKIDYTGRACCFTKSECTFRAEYAELLPNCADRFLYPAFSKSCINQLSTHGFITQLNAQFLSSKLCNKVFNLEECCLFWKFILVSQYQSHDLINEFGKFSLIPVKTQSTPCLTLISNLPAILNQKISPTSQKMLLSSLIKLNCFELSLNQINKSQKLNITALENYLRPLTISSSITYLSFMSAVKLSSLNLPSVNFTNYEANSLTDLFSTNTREIPTGDIIIISKLRIFLSHQKKLSSISEFQNCFINNSKFNFGPSLIAILTMNEITIFCANPKLDALIKHITSNLKINIINERRIFLDYVIPNFVELGTQEQQGILSFIGSVSEHYKHEFITQLRTVKFIYNPITKMRLTLSQLYSREVQLFTVFFSPLLLPAEWSHTKEKYYTVLCGAGLHNKADLVSILMAAQMIENKTFVLSSDQTILPLSSLVSFIDSNFVLSNQNKSILATLAAVRFLPVWKCLPNRIPYAECISSFSEAELSEYEHACCTTSYIHDPLVSQIDTLHQNSVGSYLCISSIPKTESVINHLETICQTFPLLFKNHSNILKNLFFETYRFLQTHCDQRSDLAKFESMQCILYIDKLFYPRNMVFSLDTILMDYLFKVSDVFNDFHGFLKLVGVADAPTYQHYAAVLCDINRDTFVSDEKRKEISRTTFGLFISSLRRAEELGSDVALDIPSTMVLTDQFKIVPLDQVVYIDNTRLKIHVKDFSDLASLQFLLELPPNSLGSCEPPAYMNIRHLSAIIHESLAPALVLAPHSVRFKNESKLFTELLKSREFSTGLIRIYYDFTKANGRGNLDLIRISSDNSVKDITKEPGTANDPQFLTIFQILQKLSVKVVDLISLQITNYLTGRVVNKDDIYSCFIENSVLYAKGGSTTQVNFFNDLTYALNVHLGNLFSDMLFALQLCLSCEDPSDIMQKLDSFNIQACPFMDDISLPQPISRPAAVLPAASLPSPVTPRTAPSSRTTPPTGVTRRRLLQIINTPPPPPTVTPISVIPCSPASLSVQDSFIAKLWIRTAQCDLRAARKLMHEDNENAIFPPHACNNCFECAMKTCIAILYINRYNGANISCQRNLDILLEIVKLFFSSSKEYERFSTNCISLINFDENAKNPLMTPGIGCCIPMEQISVSTARDAIASASDILERVKIQFPAFRELMFRDDDRVWDQPTARSLMMTQLENCKYIYLLL